MNNSIAFLPGWGFKSSIWQEIANQFPENEVILIDLPHENNDIISVINDQLPSQCMLVAWSLGGIIATDLCLNYPEKYSKLVTVASTPKFVADDEWPGINKKTISSFHAKAKSDLPTLLLTFQQLVNGKNRDASLRKLIQSHVTSDKQSLLFYLDLLMQSDKRETYNQLNIPVLHIFGDNDYLIPADCAAIIKQKNPQHKISIINNAGHIPFMTHTSEFMQHLSHFIHTGHDHE